MRIKTAAVLAAILGLAGCGGGDDPAGPDPKPVLRGIQIISGASITDSARARPTPPLIVEVHDASGALVAPGTPVRFATVEDSTGTQLAPLDGEFIFDVSSASGETDAEGRTGTLIWLGRRVGSVRIKVEVPTLGLEKIVSYTATPAALFAVDVSPSDTGLVIGRSLALRGHTQDRWGNARPEAVVWSIAGPPGATVSAAGVVTAPVVGRYEVVASFAGLADTVHVSGIPDGTLAVYDAKKKELVTIGLDGSNRTVRTTVVNGGIGVRPRWLPGSDRIIYSHYNGEIQELRVVDSAGESVRFLTQPPSTMSHQADASPAPDGSWVYFAAFDSRCVSLDYCLFRARPDGSAIDLVGNLSQSTAVTNRPSSSPDGRQVAFTTRSSWSTPSVEVLDFASGARLPWRVQGVFPQWSPVDTRIAYIDVDGAVRLINSDGSGPSRLADGSFTYLVAEPFTWSSDGLYIARRRRASPELFPQFELIVVATGEVLPLPFLDAYSEPSWK